MSNTLIRRPFPDIAEARSLFDHLLDDLRVAAPVRGAWEPPIDVHRTDDALRIVADVPRDVRPRHQYRRRTLSSHWGAARSNCGVLRLDGPGDARCRPDEGRGWFGKQRLPTRTKRGPRARHTRRRPVFPPAHRSPGRRSSAAGAPGRRADAALRNADRR